MPKTLILIPSRLSATRLPGKPLLKINGLSIISHVLNKAKESDIGEVYVCTGDKEIFEEVKNNGGKSILTNKDHKTGTDRIYEAFQKLNLVNIDYVLNLQGDEPMIDIKDIKNLNDIVHKNKTDMATLACKIKNDEELLNENIVKVQTEYPLKLLSSSRSINFSRKISNMDSENIYHHIGIYMYKISTLKQITNLPQTDNEIKFKLEQLRALENGIKIDTVLANTVPIGIDTEKDYVEIKNLIEYKF